MQFGRLDELTINTPLLIPMDSASIYPKKSQDQVNRLFEMGRDVLVENRVNIPAESKLEKLWEQQVQPAGVVTFLDDYRNIFHQAETPSG